MPSPGLPDGQVRRLHPPTPFLWMSCFYRTNKSHNGGVIKTKRCVAHLSSEHRTIGSVALVVKPSTTAEDVQAVSPLSRGGGSNTKSRYLRRQLCYEFFNSKEILAFQKDLKALEFKTLHGLCFLKCPIYIE